MRLFYLVFFMLVSFNPKALASLNCNKTLRSPKLDFSFLKAYQQPFTESGHIKDLLNTSRRIVNYATFPLNNLPNFMPERHNSNDLKKIQLYLNEKKTISKGLNTSELLLLSLVEFQLSDRQPIDARIAIENNTLLESRVVEMGEYTFIAFLWHMAHLYSNTGDHVKAYAYLFRLKDSKFLGVNGRNNVERRLEEVKTTLDQENKQLIFMFLKFKTTRKTIRLSLNITQKLNDFTTDWGPLEGF